MTQLTSHDAQAALARIKAGEGERAFLLAVLGMWSEAEAQGVDPERVRCFGFAPEYLSAKERRDCQNRRGAFARIRIKTDAEGRRVATCPFFNYYRNEGGERVRLASPIKAVYREDFDK